MSENSGFDVKNIMISILILLVIGLVIYYFTEKKMDKLEYENEQLQIRIDSIGVERDSLKNQRKKIDDNYLKLKEEKSKIDATIASKDAEIRDGKREISNQRQSIIKEEKKYKGTLKQIEEIERNPVKVENNRLVEELSKNFENL